MRRKTFITMLPASLFALKAWAAKTENKPSMKMLIIYYSWSGNTRRMANIIKNATSADIFEIIPQKPYPENYSQTVSIAKKEVDAKYKPQIKGIPENISTYDIIFVGSPNWWGTISSPMRTLLSSMDLSGKKIVPFMTHEGSRMGRSVEDIKQLCPNSEVLEALPIRGGAVDKSEQEIKNWLKSLKII